MTVATGLGNARLRLMLASSSLAALMVAAGAPAAFAAGCNINDIGATGGSISNPAAINCINVQDSTVNGNVTNAATGVIGATGGAPPTRTGITIDNSTVTGSVVNAGSITSSNGVGIIVRFNATVAGGITNSSAITANRTGILVSGVNQFGSSAAGGITNAGSITSTNTLGIGVESVSSFAGGIVNGVGATIKSGQTGIGIGTNSTVSTFAGGITNAGTISAGNIGILAGGGGTLSIFAGGISNSGTISALADVVIEHVSTFAGGIANSGTMIGVEGVAVAGVSSFASGIFNNGLIVGQNFGVAAILVSQFSGGITNAGTIAALGMSGVGIQVYADSTFTGGITNSGRIIAAHTGIATVPVTGAFPAIASFAGGIVNAGTITATAGIGINAKSISLFDGGITNSGAITAGLTGIAVNTISTFAAGLTNSGTISSVVDLGINVKSVNLFEGGITNSGAITAGGTAGISLTSIGTFTGGLTNSGTISAANGTGIAIAAIGSLAGGVSNSGSITAKARGIKVGGTTAARAVSTFSGGIANSGNIVAASHSGISIDFVANFSGGVVNSGSITAPLGIFAINVPQFAGGVTNAGKITANTGFGISLVNIGVFSGGLTNSGQIVAQKSGILIIVSNFAGGIANSGTIGAGASGIVVGGSLAAGAGLAVSTFGGGISNSGIISAVKNGILVGGTVSVAALVVSSFGGGIANTGSISAGGDGIFFGGKGSGGQVIEATFAGGISNGGAITAGANGIFVGGTARLGGTLTISAFSGGVSNSGIISAGASGIFVGGTTGGAGSVTISTFSGGITNSGTITAGLDGIRVGGVVTMGTFAGNIVNTGLVREINPSGDGINIANVSLFAGGISNSGQIFGGLNGIRIGAVATLTGSISNTGTISAANGILVVGSGAVSIFDSGTIVASVGTAVDLTGNAAGNTFTLGPGYSITGNVLGQGADTFQLGGTGNGAFNLSLIGSTQQYQGFTTFNVVSGVWNTTGTFGQTQTWNVNGGTLAGTGAFKSVNVNAGGTLEPGTVGQPGTFMTIGGNLAFQSGADYLVNIGSSTASRANVTGAVTLAGAVEGYLAPGSYNTKTTYDILDPSSITGKFTGFTAINAPGFGGTLTYNDNTDVLLNLTAQVGSGGGLNPTQRGIANQINSAFNNGVTVPAGFFPLFTLSGGALGNALSQLDGEDATGAESGAFDLTNQFLTLMLDPFVDGRSGSSASGGALGFAPDQRETLPPDVALAYAGLLKAPPQQTFAQRWSAWASGFGGSALSNGDPAVGSNNVTTSTYGYAAGLDYHYSPDTVFGFSLAGGGTNWNLANALGTGRSDAFLAGVYGVTHDGPWYLGGALAFANNWFTTNRTAMADQLTASFQGQDYSARLEGGYRFAAPLYHGAVGITPYVALQAQDFHTPAYSETDLTGGGLGLSYNAMSGTDTRSELGSRFDDLTAINNLPLILRAKVAWAHDWVSNPALNATFETLPAASFTVNGAPIPHDSALTSVGAQLFFTPNWSFLAKFDGEFADGYQLYAGSGTLRYTW